MREAGVDNQQTYLNTLFGHEDSTKAAIRKSAPAKLEGMMLSAHEGALLAWLARSINAKHILEIGSFVGYSASYLLGALPENGTLHCIEYDTKHAATIRKNLADEISSNRLQLHEGAALDILPTLTTPTQFDLIFIDADKRNYPAYAQWAANNLRTGGLLVADNTLSFGIVNVAASTPPDNAGSRAGWEAMRNLNQSLAGDNTWDTTLLPTAGGMTVARKR